MKPKLPARLAIYYGYPSLVNGARGDVNTAAAVFSKYDVVVLGDGLEFEDVNAARVPRGSGFNEHQATKNLIALIRKNSPGTRVFGYVCLGSSQALPTRELQNRIRLWQEMGAHGIFLDEAGYDFGVTRERQNKVVKYIHDRGLRAFLNSYFPDDLFSPKVVPLNNRGGGNPKGLASVLDKRDLFLLESFQIKNGAYEDLGSTAQRAIKALFYREHHGSEIMAVTTSVSRGDTFAHQFTYAWWSAVMWELDGFGWGDPVFGSSDNVLSTGFCDEGVINSATHFASPASLLNDELWRDTDQGRLAINGRSHRVTLRRVQSQDSELVCGKAQ